MELAKEKKRAFFVLLVLSFCPKQKFFNIFVLSIYFFACVFLILGKPSVYPEVNGGKFVTVQSVEEMKIQINKFDY